MLIEAINSEGVKYRARAWRTDVLRKEASAEVTKMLQSFVPEGFTVHIKECNEPVPGFPHAPNYKYSGMLHDSKPDGSDAHFFVMAYTRDGAVAKLLAHILDGGGFFPMT